MRERVAELIEDIDRYGIPCLLARVMFAEKKYGSAQEYQEELQHNIVIQERSFLLDAVDSAVNAIRFKIYTDSVVQKAIIYIILTLMLD